MCVQLFLPCYFGNEITLQYNEIRDSFYKTNWPGMSILNRKFVIKFMERLKRPVRIITFNFFVLNLATFTSVRLYHYLKFISNKYILDIKLCILAFCHPEESQLKAHSDQVLAAQSKPHRSLVWSSSSFMSSKHWGVMFGSNFSTKMIEIDVRKPIKLLNSTHEKIVLFPCQMPLGSLCFL